MSEIIITENPLLDDTLLSLEAGERQTLSTALIAEIFFTDSMYWACAFIVNFTVSGLFVADAPVPTFSPRLFLVFLLSALVVGITGYAVLLLRWFKARRLGLSAFLAALLFAGAIYTAQTGSTLVARACVIQWIMSLGTVLAAFKSGKRFIPASVSRSNNTNQSGSRCDLALPEIMAGMVIPAVLAWAVGFISEPRVVSAIVMFVPILPCAAYRYMWISHSIVGSRQYRVDEATVAWCDFYAEPVLTCLRAVPVASRPPLNLDTPQTQPDSQQ